MITYNFW